MQSNHEILNSYHAFEFENNSSDPKMFDILSSSSNLFSVPDYFGVEKVVIHFSDIQKAIFNKIKINNEIFMIADFFDQYSCLDNLIEIPLNSKTKNVDIQFTVDGNCKGRVAIFFKNTENYFPVLDNKFKQLPRFTCVVKNISNQQIFVDLGKILLGTEENENLKYSSIVIENEDGIVFDDILCVSYNEKQRFNAVNFLIIEKNHASSISFLPQMDIRSFYNMIIRFPLGDKFEYFDLFKYVRDNESKKQVNINVFIEPNTTVMYSFYNKSK